MIRSWLSLLLVFGLLFAAGAQAPAENAAEPEEIAESAAENTESEEPEQEIEEEGTDGDDSFQIPVEYPEDEEGADQEETVIEIRPLQRDDEGDDVLFLQLRLQSLQYFAGEPDGKYGKATEEAVRKFQEDNQNRGLTVTGNADVATQMLAASTHYRGLKYNDEGEDVKEIQVRLTALGYYKGKISGLYLEGTRNGIKEFQKNNGLEVTGKADPLTQEILFSGEAIGKYDLPDATPTPFDDSAYFIVNENEDGPAMPNGYVLFTKTLKANMTGSDLVKQLQERMKELGYYDGPISGNFMDKTLAAVKKIQKQNGLKVTGQVDEETWNVIFNDPAIVMPNATPKPTPTPEPAPFYIIVDVKNQIVRVYGRDENGEFTVPVREMLCSTGKVGTPSPVGDWVLNGRKAKWCYFPKWGDYARYWTRINSKVAFHSPIYYATSNTAMKTASYKMLGNRASHGCVRLSVPDAKWIYDNVGAGTVVTITEDMPVDKELKEALKLPPLSEKYQTPIETATPTVEPEYSKDNPPQLRGALRQGDRSEEVYWVQRRLKELGYYTSRCTGHFLNRTEAAVMEFQKDHGFYQSGTVDQNLIDAMVTADRITPEPDPEPAETPAP